MVEGIFPQKGAFMPMDKALLATAGDWLYFSCHCLVELKPAGVTHARQGGICDLCGNNNVKFVHTLTYLPDIEEGKPESEIRHVQVGIDCARALMGAEDAHVPVLAENETQRKRKWRIHYRRPGRCVTTVDDLDARGKL
jgi:hypothetical protein